MMNLWDKVRKGKEISNYYELHSNIQQSMTELGGRIYDLTSENKNPMIDRKVKTIMRRIENYKAKIARLQETIKKPKQTSPSKTTKKKALKTKPKS